MAQSFKETAHLNINSEVYAREHERIFGKKKESEMEKQCCCDEDVGYICCVCHEAKIKELEEMNKAQRIYFDENINLKEKLKVAVEYIVKQDCEWHRNGPCDHCEILEKIHTNERIK